jgi:oligopeptide transport system substrate-binding protein|tara:strand:+ start:478 stop:2088 length:1611 start_codon:yes stop_codon:yes gene_type:complete
MNKTSFSLLFLLFFITSCGNNVSPVDSGLENQIFHFGNGSEPQGLDPHIVTGVPEHHILIALCEGLTSSNPKGGAALPGMAESWTISEDGKTYIFNINKDAKWSNGDSVTAEDFVWSWNRVLTPSLGSQYTDMLYYVEGAKDYYEGKIDDFSQVGVKAIDQNTLEVVLNNPTPFFLGLLSHYSTWPVHKETVLKHGAIDDRNGQWTRPGNFVCNGPMQLKSWELNNKIVVEKNPFYWDAQTVRLNEMHFYPVTNIMTEDRMFRAGQLHSTYTVPAQKCPVYIENENPNLSITPYMGTYFYRTNTLNPALKDARVRKALAYSINREQIVKKVTQCGQLPAFSFTPPGANGYQPGTSIPYDLELAKSLLAEAGYPNGEGFPVLEILFNTSEDHRKIALAVQQMWQSALGINVELVNMDWKVYLSRESSGDFQISRAGWIGDYEDPNTFIDLMMPGRGNNKTGWANAEYAKLVDKANETLNQNERYDLFRQAEAILMDELPIIPIYTYVRPIQLSPDVKGWDSNYLDHHHPKYIYLERD